MLQLKELQLKCSRNCLFQTPCLQSCFLCLLFQAKEKYEKSLDELNKCTPQYMESMEQVFDQCQQHEVKRLTFLKEALLDIKRHLNLTEGQRLVNTNRQVTLLYFYLIRLLYCFESAFTPVLTPSVLKVVLNLSKLPDS